MFARANVVIRISLGYPNINNIFLNKGMLLPLYWIFLHIP